MLKQKLTSAPNDDLKGAYVQKGDEWFLDALADDHPKMVENKTLIEEKRAVEAELSSLKANVGNIERELGEARQKGVPSGHRAVSVEIAELGQLAKSEGFTKDTLPETKKKIDTFEREKMETTENSMREKVADSLKKQRELFSEHAAAKGLRFAERMERIDGKDVPYYVVLGKGEDGVEREIRAADYVKDKANYLPDAAEKKQGFQFSSEGGTNPPKNEWEQYREEGKAAAQAAAPAAQSVMFAALDKK